MTTKSTMKALVIDDDRICRMGLSFMLRQFASIEVLEVEDGAAAWQMMADGMRPVICCCDVQMPGLSGLELLERMKSTVGLADIPFVLVSGENDMQTIQQAVKLGAAAYLRKPLQPAQALERLGKLLEKSFAGIIEMPAATLERLRIDGNRLTTYLQAYETQVRSQIEPLAAALAAGDAATARNQLAALQKGGHTLGLWQAAENLAQLAQGDIDESALRDTLTRVSAAAAAQAKLVKAGLPAA